MKLSRMAKYLIVTLAASGLTIVSFWAIAGDSTSAGGPPPSGQTTSGGQTTTTSGGQTTTTSGEQPVPKRAGTAKPSTDSVLMKKARGMKTWAATTVPTAVYALDPLATNNGWSNKDYSVASNQIPACGAGQTTYDSGGKWIRKNSFSLWISGLGYTSFSQLPYYSRLKRNCCSSAAVCGHCIDGSREWVPSKPPGQGQLWESFMFVKGGNPVMNATDYNGASYANGDPATISCGHHCSVTAVLDSTSPTWYQFVAGSPGNGFYMVTNRTCYTVTWSPTT